MEGLPGSPPRTASTSTGGRPSARLDLVPPGFRRRDLPDSAPESRRRDRLEATRRRVRSGAAARLRLQGSGPALLGGARRGLQPPVRGPRRSCPPLGRQLAHPGIRSPGRDAPPLSRIAQERRAQVRRQHGSRRARPHLARQSPLRRGSDSPSEAECEQAPSCSLRPRKSQLRRHTSNRCETYLATRSHCGACGHCCSAGLCVNGACEPPGARNISASITSLRNGAPGTARSSRSRTTLWSPSPGRCSST